MDNNTLDKYGCNTLTPVELHENIYFKRDDLFVPFKDIPLSGGKVRQCISLLKYKEDYIKSNCGNLVVTGTSVHSPQGIIVTKVARELGIDSCIFIGNSKPETIKKNILMMNILYQGGRIDFSAKLGYENVLSATIRKKYPKAYHISFGINASDCPEAILGSVANQVENIPDELDYLVVPCGSCIMFSGILQGIKKFDKKVKEVVGIQISGYDRIETIKKLVNDDLIPYTFLISKDYPYAKYVKINVDGIQLDPLYEAKAYDYMVKYLKYDIKGKKVLFWLVGNSNSVRNTIYKNVNVGK